MTLILSRTDKSVCPVTALLPYLAVRGSKRGPSTVLHCVCMLYVTYHGMQL